MFYAVSGEKLFLIQNVENSWFLCFSFSNQKSDFSSDSPANMRPDFVINLVS